MEILISERSKTFQPGMITRLKRYIQQIVTRGNAIRFTWFKRLFCLLLSCAAIALAGCAGPTTSSIPLLTGSDNRPGFQIHEYPIIEQSVDNPTHPQFAQRVPAAISAQRYNWHFRTSQESAVEINQALATFGFSLKVNENPPYSSFSLYKNDDLVQRNIARFWSVSVSHDSLNQSRDFLLPFLTVSGEKLVANTTGVRPWPGEASENTPPVYYDGEIAYAQETHGKVSVYAGPNILYIAQSPQATSPDPESNVQGLQTWEQAQDQSKHWALEIDGDVIQDGQDLKKINRYDTVFGFQVLDNQPMYFFTKNGLTYLNINGQSQPYRYDTIVHDKTGNLSIFNPGASGEVIWFYALRDGLWYYVEAGFFQ